MPARLPSVPDQRYLGVERLGLKGEVKPEDFVGLAKNQCQASPMNRWRPAGWFLKCAFSTIPWAAALLRCPVSELLFEVPAS